MPVEFLSDEQAAGYGSFVGVPDRADLERCFYLDDEDLRLVAVRRGDHNRLGFAVQLTTVRFLGVFLEDPVDVPSEVIDYLAAQLDIDGVSVLNRYLERSKTAYEHQWEISEALGFRQFAAMPVRDELVVFLRARAWTQPERPSQLFDRAVAWLRAEKVLLPGVTVLTRLVSEIRTSEAERLQTTVAARISPALAQRLDGLLVVTDVSRWSRLELLRRAPVRSSGPEMVRALDRATTLVDVGTSEVGVSDVPAGRWASLARYGLSTKAAMLRRMPDDRRLVTLLATVDALRVEAFDDAIDLFANLMSTKLIRAAERKSDKERLRTLPQLSKASSTLAATAKVLLDAVDDIGEGPDADELWSRLDGVVSREQLAAAIDTVTGIAPPDGHADGLVRAELVKRYATVRPFLTRLATVVPFESSDAGTDVLRAVRGLGDLPPRVALVDRDVVGEVVSGSWTKLVFDPKSGVIDRRAYVMCVLEALHRALRRRDIFLTDSKRWADPRARLLDGAEWAATQPRVLAALQLSGDVDVHLDQLAGRLDGAYLDLAKRVGNDGSVLAIEEDAKGVKRLHLSPLTKLDQPPSLVELDAIVKRMLPRIDLADLLLEVHKWTGIFDEFVHHAMVDTAVGTRMEDHAISMAAVLVAEGCNLGYTPVVKAGIVALSRDRLSHVSQNYVRTETLSAANKRLIEAQAHIATAQTWGGGLVATVDGLRFVVPVRTLDAAPNPHYFGKRKGVTWLNAINDQVQGIGAVVVTGTMRDSLHVLDVILNRDGGPKPEMIATDTASYSDIVFGLFRLLGYQFSPRLADLPDQRLWRLTPPGTERVDYGPLNGIARSNVSYKKIREQWPDMLRVAGSLHTGSVAGYDLIRMLARDGNPTPLGAAIGEYGRPAKTLHLLKMVDPDDETYRRLVHTRLGTQESRHRLARKVLHGQRGELRQKYRQGQEDQLGILGLVLNAIVLWNTRYIDAALDKLRQQGHAVDDGVVRRLSPLADKHINVHGRYSFSAPAPAGLRALRDPDTPDDPDG